MKHVEYEEKYKGYESECESAYKEWINKTVRQFDFRMEFNGTELTTSDISSIKINSDLLTGDTFSIGSSVSETLEFDLFMDADTEIDKTLPIRPYMSLYTEVVIERIVRPIWQEVCLGTFYINPDGVTKKGLKTISIKASSMLTHTDFGGRTYVAPEETEEEREFQAKDETGEPMFDDNGNPVMATEKVKVFNRYISEAINTICDDLKISKPTNIPNVIITKRENIDGMTYREVINYAAMLYGGYARVNNDYQLEFFKMNDTKYIYDTDNYISLSKEDDKLTIKSFICATSNESSITSGSGFVSETVELTCPDMTQEILDGILNTYIGYGYNAITCKIFGNPRLEAGDRVSIIDVKGNKHELPLQNITYNISGSGITMDIKSLYKANSISKGTSVRKSINGIQQEMVATKIIVDEVQVQTELVAKSVKANNANIARLEANNVIINEQLQAVDAKIGTLDVDQTVVGSLTATNARIDDLIAGNVTIQSLDVIKLEVEDLTVKNTANIETLSKAQTDITSLQENKADKTELAETNKTLAELSGKIDTNQGGTNENKTKIEEIESDLSNFKSTVSNDYLTKSEAFDTYLSKTDANNTYATKNGLSSVNSKLGWVVKSGDSEANMELTDRVYSLIEVHISLQSLLDRISELESKVAALENPEDANPEEP